MSKLIYIGAGHSGFDPGAIANGVTETAIVLELRDLISVELTRMGAFHIIDGRTGENLTLASSIAIAKQADGLRIELHCNASTNSAANGTEVIANESKKVIAQALAKTISSVLGTRLRGDNGFITQEKTARGRLAFVQDADGLIVELFFITNRQELFVYRSTKKVLAKRLAEAIVELNNEKQ